jgi:hypothetical protein
VAIRGPDFIKWSVMVMQVCVGFHDVPLSFFHVYFFGRAYQPTQSRISAEMK